jgi:hypothetical protein
MADINCFTEQELYKILQMEDDITVGYPTDYKKAEIAKKIKSHLKDTDNPELIKLYKDIEERLLAMIAESSADLDRAYNETSGDKTKTTDHGNVVIQGEPDDQVTYSGDIARGKINPTRKSVITRTINLDSQYRANLDDVSSDYTVVLSENVKNVISLSLASVEIPFTWYTFDTEYGTTCFWVDDYVITITSGNYTPTELISEISGQIIAEGKGTGATYNPITGKCTLNIAGDVLMFYDETGTLTCSTKNCLSGSNNGSRKNYNLGYLLGFSQQVYKEIPEDGNIMADGVLQVEGSKYLLLVIDDFKASRLNNGLVSIVHIDQNLNIPEYFTDDVGFSCSGETILPVGNAPRVLTESQLYTVNEILFNRSNTTEHRLVSPTTTDILSRIPITYIGMNFLDTYIATGGMIGSLKREYFGPVDLGSLHIKLLDERGNVLNLNNRDWSVSLTCEQLYQY